MWCIWLFRKGLWTSAYVDVGVGLLMPSQGGFGLERLDGAPTQSKNGKQEGILLAHVAPTHGSWHQSLPAFPHQNSPIRVLPGERSTVLGSLRR